MAGSARPAEPAYADELERNLSSSLQRRRRLGRVLVIVFVGLPAAIMLSRHGFTGRAVFLVPATVAYMVLIDRVVALGPSAWSRRWLALPVIVGLAAATFAVGGMSWLGGFAIATASTGRLAPSRRLMAASVTCCAAIGLGIGLWRHLSYSNLLSVAVVPALAGLLAFSAERAPGPGSRCRPRRASGGPRPVRRPGPAAGSWSPPGAPRSGTGARPSQQREAVAEQVMQVPGDPEPLLGDGHPGQLGTGLGEPVPSTRAARPPAAPASTHHFRAARLPGGRRTGHCHPPGSRRRAGRGPSAGGGGTGRGGESAHRPRDGGAHGRPWACRHRGPGCRAAPLPRHGP